MSGVVAGCWQPATTVARAPAHHQSGEHHMHTPTKLGAAVLSAALLLAIPSQAMAADTNPQGGDNHFDLQAHRGGLGLTVDPPFRPSPRPWKPASPRLNSISRSPRTGAKSSRTTARSATRSARHRPRDARGSAVPVRRQVRQGPHVRPGPQPRLRHADAAAVPRPAGRPRRENAHPGRGVRPRGFVPRQPGEVQHRNQGRGRRAGTDSAP